MPETSRSSEALSKRLIELTSDLVLIPSTRERPDEVARCMEFVVQHLELPEAITVRRFLTPRDCRARRNAAGAP